MMKTTNSPEEATVLAFEALEQAKVFPADKPYGPFNEVGFAWGAKRLYRGPLRAIRELVKGNLLRICCDQGFSHFQIHMRTGHVVQISALFSDGFTGVQIWKAGEEYLANGNSDFRASGALSTDQRIRVETIEGYETAQREAFAELVNSGEGLVCHVCRQAFLPEECQNVVLEGKYVMFDCPSCHIRALYIRESDPSV